MEGIAEYALFEGLEVGSPRDAFRTAAELHLIDDPTIWFEFLKDRNRTTHLYDEKQAKDVVSHLPSFVKETEILIKSLQSAVNK